MMKQRRLCFAWSVTSNHALHAYPHRTGTVCQAMKRARDEDEEHTGTNGGGVAQGTCSGGVRASGRGLG